MYFIIVKYLTFFLSILLIPNIFFYIQNAYSDETSTPINIANPMFTTKGVDEMPYSIKADSGIQRGDDLELIKIEGKIKNHNGIWIYLNADKGSYNQTTDMVFLFDNIEVYIENKEKLKSDEAIVNIKEDKITMITNVEYVNQDNKITADKAIISSDFQNFEYLGNVQTFIKNE